MLCFLVELNILLEDWSELTNWVNGLLTDSTNWVNGVLTESTNCRTELQLENWTEAKGEIM